VGRHVVPEVKKHIFLVCEICGRPIANVYEKSSWSMSILGTCKVRNEIETKRNETKRNRTKRNKIKRNEMKRRYISFRFVSFRSGSFRFVLFDFVSLRFVSISFRTLQVPSFDSGFSKNEILELIVFKSSSPV
jgi:hypothetical protein